MTETVNIVCILWKGDFRGRDFRDSDVVRLYLNVCEHITIPFEFYCLTNDMNSDLPASIRKIPLKYNWKGWWAKMELHRPDLPFSGRTLYVDLDTTIVDSLDRVFDVKGNLVMSRAKSGIAKRENWKIVTRYQAAVMLFTPNSSPNQVMWEGFMENPDYWINEYRSEQDLIGEWLPGLVRFPDKWVMKLAKISKNKSPKGAIFVTGQPKYFNFRDFVCT